MSPIDFAFIFSSYQDMVDLDVSVWAFLFFFLTLEKPLKSFSGLREPLKNNNNSLFSSQYIHMFSEK